MSALLSNLKYTLAQSWLFVFSNNTSAFNTFHDHQRMLASAMALLNIFGFGPIDNPAPCNCKVRFINSKCFAQYVRCVIGSHQYGYFANQLS